jgi:uracil-DNA glycosylase
MRLMTRDNRLLSPDACNTHDLPACWHTVLAQANVNQALTAVTAQIAINLDNGAAIYPHDPWRALRQLPLAQVRVVILGQDPYHGVGQAQGLAFSVPNNCKTPPSLRNILQEVARGEAQHNPNALQASQQNDLSNWVSQGVLLLNTALTVEDGQPASHSKIGWAIVTDAIIAAVAAQTERPVVFMLWGQHAQSKHALIYADKHLVLSANHPSPLSARRPPIPFLGCGHFVRANEWLKSFNKSLVQWL